MDVKTFPNQTSLQSLSTSIDKMGNDGGSIPTRRELVKESAKPKTLTEAKEKQKEHQAHRWSQCPLSHVALKPPIVADHAGDLYNKDAIIQFLLDANTSEDAKEFVGGRVKGLKDVVEVKFEEEDEKWVCPVTRKDLKNVKAVYVVPCGHAFSAEAMKQVGGGECVVCTIPYIARDVCPILPASDEDKEAVMDRIESLRVEGLSHSLKKDKSKKRKKDEDKEEKKVNGNGSSKAIKDEGVAALTAKVSEEEARKKRKTVENENIQSLYSKSDGKARKNNDFMTRGFSIPAGGKK